MPVFEIESGGKTFEVDAPSMDAAVAAMQGGGDAPADAGGSEFGITDTWPFRLARSLYSSAKDAATLPGDVYTGKQDVSDPSTIGRSLNFAAAATGVNPAVRSGERAIAGVGRATGKGAPSKEQLKGVAGKQFDDFRNSGIKIRGDSMREFAQRVRQELEDAGITQIDAPDTYAKIKLLESAPEGGFMSAANFHAARKSFSKTAGKAGPDHATERGASSWVLGQLDRFLGGLDETGLVAGTPAGELSAAKQSFRDATGNYAAYKRSDDLSANIKKSELQADAANSGQNIGNKLRQRMVSIATNPKATRGYSKEEVAKMEDIATGTPATNAARYVGNLLGGGGGLGQIVAGGIGAAGGGAVGGPLGAAIGAGLPTLTGMLSKGAENYLVRRSVRGLDDATRMRSPLAGQGVRAPAADAATRAALGRLLLLYQLQNQNQI